MTPIPQNLTKWNIGISKKEILMLRCKHCRWRHPRDGWCPMAHDWKKKDDPHCGSIWPIEGIKPK